MIARRIASALIWTMAGFLTVCLWVASALSVLLTGRCDPDRRFTHRFSRYWAWAVVKTNPFWNLTVKGRQHLNDRACYIFVSNHQSMADIVLLPFVGVPYKCFAKSELFRVPFFGWTLSLNRHIKLRRGSLRGIAQAMKDARYWVDRGMPVAFFAEGTRSRDGSLAQFKGGAFKLAIQTGTPIVPLAMKGTRDVLPKGQFIFNHRVRGSLIILPPIETKGYEMKQIDDLRGRTLDAIESALTGRAGSPGVGEKEDA